MVSREEGYLAATATEKFATKQRISAAELELWLEKSLQDRARNVKRGVEKRVEVFIELLEKIAAADPVFGHYIDRALIDINAERDVSPPEVVALQKLRVQEKRLQELRDEVEKAEADNKALKEQLEETRKIILRRQKELNDQEQTIRDKSDYFQKQRSLNAEFQELFDMCEEPILEQEENHETEAPQIITLRLHNDELREKVRAMERCIDIAKDEIEAINALRL